MNSFYRRLKAIDAVESDNFLDLVEAAKLNPKRDFIHADLTNMDFGGLDLTEFEFFGADFRNSDLNNTKVRIDRCIGAYFGQSLPDFIETSGSVDHPQSELRLFGNSQNNNNDEEIIFQNIRKITSLSTAFARMAFAIRFVQDAPNVAAIQRFAEIALNAERSSWCRKLLSHLTDDHSGNPRSLIEAQALDAAVRAVHSLRRHELLWALEDYVARTDTLFSYLDKLRRRTRSVKNLDSIDRILADREVSE